ncbi:glucosamine-6-phosphate deaminase [Xinfangfangia sp. D13-10-4-6]|uniref:glucosamine-6-phosphate deaminase n=1 Tax=Pseudogemmobacter hezensis TaxID=2737662 RepID=UPI0015543AA2|nr:glucosamine-6-phosphate deaminase [Pseudogemmobacter hezensis]NPD16085.1 glucosamine-6-phosphate deaminase [Pseudogemmobacter hezensis]
MNLHILKDAGAVARAAASLIAQKVKSAEIRTLGLATGRSPIAVYDDLSARVAAKELSFAGITSFNLDEYIGLSAQNPASFHAFMQRHFFGKVTLAAHHLPDGMAADPAHEAQSFENAIKQAGGIDLQLLGIGRNGHIGFNEPGSALDSRTRLVTLSDSTRSANAPDFPTPGDVPHSALTMGIGTILEAREQLLIATGTAKACAIRAALRGPVSADCPASALQLHALVHVFIDEDAAALL